MNLDELTPRYDNLKPPRHHFNTLAGHATVKRMLWNMIERGRLPHALVFEGPAGVGKRSMAYALAKVVNGGPGDADIATASRVGRLIASEEYVDLRVVESKGYSGQIVIGDMREITDWAYLTPTEARRKVILIPEADRLNVSAANAFLKVLEEPPDHCLILLTTARPHALLTTIRSRCARVAMPPLPQGEVKDWLKAAFGLNEDDAAVAALLGEGCPGRAAAQLVEIEAAVPEEGESLWDAVERARKEDGPRQGVSADRRRAVAEAMEDFYAQGFPATFKTAWRLREASEDSLNGALTLLLLWFRDLTLRAVMGEESERLVVNRDLLSSFDSPSAPTEPSVLTASMRETLRAMDDVHRPRVDAQMALEALLIRLGRANRERG